MHLVDLGELHFAIIKVILLLNINVFRLTSLILSLAPTQGYD